MIPAREGVEVKGWEGEEGYYCCGLLVLVETVISSLVH